MVRSRDGSGSTRATIAPDGLSVPSKTFSTTRVTNVSPSRNWEEVGFYATEVFTNIVVVQCPRKPST